MEDGWRQEPAWRGTNPTMGIGGAQREEDVKKKKGTRRRGRGIKKSKKTNMKISNVKLKTREKKKQKRGNR